MFGWRNDLRSCVCTRFGESGPATVRVQRKGPKKDYMKKYDLLNLVLIASLSSIASGQQVPDPLAVPSPQTQGPALDQVAPAPGTDSSTVFEGSFFNAPLIEVINVLAQKLKMNYIVDPRVQGGVTLTTYGEKKTLDTYSLLEAILRINGYGIVKQGEFYRIVPVSDIMHLSISPETKEPSNTVPDDDKTILNLVYVKYLSADELLKVLNPFLGENAKAFTYPPANLMLILDSRRNVRRLLGIIALFDDVKFERERVRLFALKNARPSNLATELEGVIKPLFAAANFAGVVLLPLDRIGAIVAVAKSASVFPELEQWILKLDIPAARTPDTLVDHVYKVKFGDAKELASSIMALYGGGGGAASGTSSTRSGATFGNQLTNPVGLPSPMRADLGPGSYVGNAPSDAAPRNPPLPLSSAPFAPPNSPSADSSRDFTGNYMSAVDSGGQRGTLPRVVARASNYLMIQALPVDYENILSLLKELDVPPRQVLIEAKIYEVDLTYSFSSSVSATLQELAANSVHQFLGNLSGSITNLTIGGLIGRSRELLSAVQLEETQNRAKVISAPSIIVTDGIPASMNVGTTVPTLSAQAVTNAQQGGSSLFANSIVNQDSGITLSVAARVNPSGVVTLDLSEQVSAPIPPSSTGIQSPSFSNRTVETRVTLQDGDTIAIGGIIDEQNTSATSGIPYLNRLPAIGWLFGSRSYNKSRTELIMFVTLKVIYDNNDVTEASEELKERLKDLQKMSQER